MKKLFATLVLLGGALVTGCAGIQIPISDSLGESTQISTEQTTLVTTTQQDTDPLILEFSDTTLSLEKSAMKVGIGEQRQIAIAQCPVGYEDKLVWASSHPAYATVDANGTVTGHANGVSTISVSIEGAGVYQSITVYVN